MRRIATVVVGVAAWSGVSAWAQQPQVDLSALPAQIKTLAWQGVDWSAVSPVDQARALMLLDQTLEEIGGQMTAEADLMSQYIDQANLGGQFVSQAPEAAVKPLTMQDAEKIAVALLKGPMAQSSYATAIGDASGSVLTAYLQMYESTCNRKWGGAMDSRRQVNEMTRFLQASGKMADYNAWVPGEVQRRTQQADAEAAARRAAAQQQQTAAQQEQIKRQQQLLEQQRQQFQQQQQASQQMQQAMCSAQQSQQASAAPAASGDAYPNWYYGGLGYAGTGAWYRDAAYRGAACAATEARMGAWHRGGFRR